MTAIDRETFSQYVKDLLTHYHDPARLQTHPLGRLLLPISEPEGTRAQALRKQVLAAINLLQPDEAIPYGDPAWWPHRTLWMRYIEGQDVAAICAELAIGRTSFYEQHNAGLHALIDILWRQYAERAHEAQQVGSVEAIRKELGHMAQAAPGEAVSLEQVLRSALETLAPLAQQYGAEIALVVSPDLSPVLADPAILRQVFINLLAEAVNISRARPLALRVQAEATNITCRVSLPATNGITADELTTSPGLRVGRTLLDGLGGQVDVQANGSGGLAVSIILPLHRDRAILIVDNDPDTVNLYRRYLQAEAYTVHTATSSEEARQVIAQTPPDLILLDLLMPKEDGWRLLQEIKRSPATAHIPVIVCSVLEQPQLALALGAADVLNKPIERPALLQAIKALLAREYSGR